MLTKFWKNCVAINESINKSWLFVWLDSNVNYSQTIHFMFGIAAQKSRSNSAVAKSFSTRIDSKLTRMHHDIENE